MKKNRPILLSLVLLFVISSCNLPVNDSTPAAEVSPATEAPATSTFTPEPTVEEPTATIAPSPTPEPPTPTKTIPHSLIPATNIKMGKLINDVTSVDTAAEGRAPYGDLYKANLFERPFLQDMTYVADLDIVSYNLAYDEKFYYISIELVGTNPNNPMGINYAVELDLNRDGFGDYVILASPPHNVNWTTDNVQVFQDTDRDTGGLSAELSDGPLPGNGYDTLIFNGGRGENDTDLDLAWARVNAGDKATVQFAFKKALAGDKFLYGVLADGGPKNVEDLDYVDRFSEEQAGSPVRDEEFFPLKALFGVDNVCREAFGFIGTNQEPQRCKMGRQ